MALRFGYLHLTPDQPRSLVSGLKYEYCGFLIADRIFRRNLLLLRAQLETAY